MKQDGEKKPDLVVFNEETQQYDAALKPYGTSASSPVIKPLNTATWRNDGVQRVNKQFKSKFDEVRKEYEELMQKFQYNDLVYNSKFNFEPNIGEVYHLYNNRKEEDNQFMENQRNIILFRTFLVKKKKKRPIYSKS